MGSHYGRVARIWTSPSASTPRKQILLQSLVLDQIRDMVTITDLEGNVTYVNQSEVETLKRPREEFLDNHVGSYGEDPDRGATQQEILEKTLAQGEWRRRSRQLRYRWTTHHIRCAHPDHLR